VKQPYIENYIHGLYNLTVYPIKEIVHGYDNIYVKVEMTQDRAKKHRGAMENIGWKLAEPLNALDALDKNLVVWLFYTGPVTR
jgi:hypothetical protein